MGFYLSEDEVNKLYLLYIPIIWTEKYMDYKLNIMMKNKSHLQIIFKKSKDF